MQFPTIPDAVRLERLQPPTTKVRMVLDTDTYNEIDDQFAVVYALQSPEKLDVEAIHAAPFHNKRSSGPADGMEKSYEEILRLLERLDVSADGFAFRGSESYLPASDQGVDSPAVRDLIERAMKSKDEPLYVVAIGAITNVASAILIEPEIINKIVVVWLGGNAPYWPNPREFNLRQDVPAAQVILNCGVPFVQVPCHPVASHITTTVPEIERYVQGQDPIGDYLAEIFKGYHDDHFAYGKVIWDIAAVAWLIDPSFLHTHLAPSPVLNSECTWSVDLNRHFVRIATFASRNKIFRDLFQKLQRCAK